MSPLGLEKRNICHGFACFTKNYSLILMICLIPFLNTISVEDQKKKKNQRLFTTLHWYGNK